MYHTYIIRLNLELFNCIPILNAFYLTEISIHFIWKCQVFGLINKKQLLCWAFIFKRCKGNLSSWFPESPLFFGSVHEEPRRSGGWRARITFPITHNNAKNSKVQPATPKVLLAGFVNLAERGSISSHVEWKSPWRATGFPFEEEADSCGCRVLCSVLLDGTQGTDFRRVCVSMAGESGSGHPKPQPSCGNVLVGAKVRMRSCRDIEELYKSGCQTPATGSLHRDFSGSR